MQVNQNQRIIKSVPGKNTRNTSHILLAIKQFHSTASKTDLNPESPSSPIIALLPPLPIIDPMIEQRRQDVREHLENADDKNAHHDPFTYLLGQRGLNDFAEA